MPFYQRLGEVPRKRHIQFRENGNLLTEEVMGLEGFTGNESILYHLQSPCRVAKLDGFEKIERDEWVPEQHNHLHLKTFDIPEEGDEITGRRLLMWNNDVEISLCRPQQRMHYFFRNGEGDEVIFVHEGSGTLETIFGDLPYKEGDYIVVPRGTTYRFAPQGPQRQVVVLLGHPLLALDRNEPAELRDAARRLEVVEDRLVPREPLEAHDLLGEERAVLAEHDVTLGRNLAETLVERHEWDCNRAEIATAR